jgi:ATP-dependent DNA helicase DinG
MQVLATVSEMAPDFVRLHERASVLAERAAAFCQPCPAGSVRWVDVGSQLRLVESPLDIARAVQEKLLRRGSEEESRRAWIFTSATLGDDAKLSWFTEPCGLGEAEVLRVGSPFDYLAQAAVYVPRDLPRWPRSPPMPSVVSAAGPCCSRPRCGRCAPSANRCRRASKARSRWRCWCRDSGRNAG